MYTHLVILTLLISLLWHSSISLISSHLLRDDVDMQIPLTSTEIEHAQHHSRFGHQIIYTLIRSLNKCYQYLRTMHWKYIFFADRSAFEQSFVLVAQSIKKYRHNGIYRVHYLNLCRNVTIFVSCDLPSKFLIKKAELKIRHTALTLAFPDFWLLTNATWRFT